MGRGNRGVSMAVNVVWVGVCIAYVVDGGEYLEDAIGRTIKRRATDGK